LSLFDLWEDPAERNNLIGQFLEKVDELIQKSLEGNRKIMNGKRLLGISTALNHRRVSYGLKNNITYRTG
jgi:hypothetical protein